MEVSIKNFYGFKFLILFFVFFSVTFPKVLLSDTLHDKTYLFRPDHNTSLKIKDTNYQLSFMTFTNAFTYEGRFTYFIQSIMIFIEKTKSFIPPTVNFLEKDILEYKEEVKYLDKDNLKFTFKITYYDDVVHDGHHYFKEIKMRVLVETIE